MSVTLTLTEQDNGSISTEYNGWTITASKVSQFDSQYMFVGLKGSSLRVFMRMGGNPPGVEMGPGGFWWAITETSVNYDFQLINQDARQDLQYFSELVSTFYSDTYTPDTTPF